MPRLSLRTISLANLGLPLVGVLVVYGVALYYGAWPFVALLTVEQAILFYAISGVILDPAFREDS